MAEQEVGFKRVLENASVGLYIPPAKRRQLLKEREEAEQKKLELEQKKALNGGEEGNVKQQTKDGETYSSAFPNGEVVTVVNTETRLHEQRETWQEQRKVINGTINRLNAGTIKILIQDLFQKVNLVRLRGPLCKSVLSAAVSSPKYSDVYAAIIAVVNSKLPEVGELMVKRTILSFRRYYKQREKASFQAVCVFLVHLFHQGVVHELIVLQLLSVLLDGARPTDDSVEVAVHVLQIAGQALLDVSSAGVRACTERMRSLLHEGHLNHRVEYRVEELLKARKNGFKDYPSLAEELDLVEQDDQITFDFSLDDEDIQKEEELDRFSFDPKYEEHEAEWKAIRAEILGGDSSDDESDSDDDSDDDSSDDDSEEEESASGENALAVASGDGGDAATKQVAVVEDLTEADLVNLRRTIYLTIMSSATFEECAHKLARIDVPPGRELELINMLIECCSQERTFLRYYGLIASRFCNLDERWKNAFMESFTEQYNTIHRLETNKLRNVAKLFSHLLHTDSMPWSVLSVIHLNEDETTSSSRIFIKIVIQEMAEAMGIAKLKVRFDTKNDEHKLWYAGMFPKDNVRNTRYAINFFTSIGLGPLTDDLREFLKNAPKLILAKAKEAALAKKEEGSGDESSSVSSTSSSSSSSSSSYSTSSYSSYTSSSSYSSSSFSSRGSSSYSRERRRGRSSDGKRNKRDRRRREYSSDSSVSSRSSSGSSSRSPSSDASRRRRRRGKDNRRSSRRSRSRSPPKIISSEKKIDDLSEDRSRSGDKSRSPSSSRSASRRRSRSGNKEPSRSPPKVITSMEEKKDRSHRRSSSRSVSTSPSRERRKESADSRGRSRSKSSPKIISSGKDDRHSKRSPSSRSPSLSRSRSRSPPRSNRRKDTENRSRNTKRRRSRSSSRSASSSPSRSRSNDSSKISRRRRPSARRKSGDAGGRNSDDSSRRGRSRSPPHKNSSNERNNRDRDIRSHSRSPMR
mmetsp:Transcript_4465/g.12900  ORF Transcript_4465/g.12900 Transcript_4465/m.12900 type:complete len:973 (+) Transcript_4465:221-3139(+)